MSLAMHMILAVTGPRTLSQFTAHCRTPMVVQDRLLQHILQKNAPTAFGRRFTFDGIGSIREYKKRVPILSYEEHRPYIDAQMQGHPLQLTTESPIFFATTSGTTGRPKYIPVTPESRSAKSQLVRLFLYTLYQAHRTMFSGKILTVISPEIESYAPCGTPCGAESGHMYRNMPAAMQTVYACPYEVCTIPDYTARYYTLLRIAAGQSLSVMFACNPSTILLLAERLAEYSASIIRDVRDGTLTLDAPTPSPLASLIQSRLSPDPSRAAFLEECARKTNGGTLLPNAIWPHMKIVTCWKGGMAKLYLERLTAMFSEDLAIRDIGYVSSEHRGSIPLSDEGDSGVLAVPTNFYEFYPADEDRPPRPLDLLTLDELEEGQQYFIYVTTLGGLYRYNMNDMVEVTGYYHRTPMIRFVQKGKGVVSFTGEKLYERQVIEAVAEGLTDFPGAYEFIAAIGEFADRVPRYAFLIEFDSPPSREEARQLVVRLDQALRRQNQEYASKRDSQRLDPPVIRLVRRGEFDRYRQRMVEQGRHDAQFKILRLTADPAFAQQFAMLDEFDDRKAERELPL